MKANSEKVIPLIITIVALQLGLFQWIANAQSEEPMPADAITRELERFQQALESRDTLVIRELYSEKAVSLLQNHPVRIGRDAIMGRWKKSLAMPISIRVIPQEINLSPAGQDAFQYGTFEIHSADTSHTLVASGKLMFLWRREGDRWRIAFEMDNFDATKPQNVPSAPMK